MEDKKNILDDCLPIRRQKDGTYIIKVNGCDYGVCDNNEGERFTIKMIEKYTAANPDKVIPEPEPPKPTPEQIAEAKRRTTLAQLDELDRKSARYLRASIAGTIDEEGKKRLSAIEKEATSLRKSLSK